jgi:hypothetical protein
MEEVDELNDTTILEVEEHDAIMRGLDQEEEEQERARYFTSVQESPILREQEKNKRSMTMTDQMNQSIVASGFTMGRAPVTRRSNGYNGIIPYARRDELKDFYTDRRPSESLVKEEFKRKNMSEEMKAQWVIEQFRVAAEHLGVHEIIDGKKKIPVLPPLSDYNHAFDLKSQRMKQSMAEVIEEKRRFILVARANLDEVDKKNDWDQAVEGKSKSQTMVDIVGSIKKERSEILELERNMEDRESKDAREASRQRDADADALMKLNEAMDHLKKLLGDLMKKVPSVEGPVRWKGQDGYNQDPYEIGDLTRVMKNLNFHYRGTTGLGKMTLLVSGLKEAQGSRTAAQHLLSKEDWLKTLKSVGITTIDVEELVALATIALFDDAHRNAFIEAETQLAQT